jgi:outer membrane protein assembly factor BamB
MEPVWVKDVLDDTNNTPVISIENDHPYLYISTGFHGGWRAPTTSTAPVPIWKIDAVTGETVWQVDYTCFTVSGVSGGVQGTIATGKYDLIDLIFVPVARTPTGSAGTLAAISKSTGEVVWEFQTSRYSWSSPVCVYTEDGKGYVVYTNADANLYLLDGLTGEQLDRINLGSLIEASPAIYENMIVIGTRCQRIWGVRLT